MGSGALDAGGATVAMARPVCRLFRVSAPSVDWGKSAENPRKAFSEIDFAGEGTGFRIARGTERFIHAIGDSHSRVLPALHSVRRGFWAIHSRAVEGGPSMSGGDRGSC